MGYRNLRQCIDDLEANGRLVRVPDPVDAYLEAAEIHRRVFRSGGPAVLFEKVVDCRFPMVSNLFGTMDRALFLFRDTLERVQRLIELKMDPARIGKQPLRYARSPWTAWTMMPKPVRRGPIQAQSTSISHLPQIVSWPRDGGAYVLLPMVYTEDVTQPGLLHSNLGMYRVQLSGGAYEPDREIGLHYQIHRGIGVHHQRAIEAGKPFRVNIFVGGAPAMMLAAVMPLPEGLSELTFAGALAGHRIRMVVPKAASADRTNQHLPIYGEADFCICGTVIPDKLSPEGPFGDHLGYYSLAHDFPVLRVDAVYHRTDPIWPFTIVGRPPQEDTIFGELIHELTGPVIPKLIPGLHAVHAVDAAGVHPLLLAIGSERYTPYEPIERPAELLTQANALLGQGQLSLAKYVLIVNHQDDPTLDIHDIERFFKHLLERVDWRRDLHFQTCTTIDTLDYSSRKLNEGSKVVMAAAGPVRRELAVEPPPALRLPDGFHSPRVCLPGVLAVTGPKASLWDGDGDPMVHAFCEDLSSNDAAAGFPLIVIVDDSDFVARRLDNFLWVVFTRSDPAADVYGAEAFTELKHWGCRGSLVIDGRIKPHHAPLLEEDSEVTKKVDARAARGGPLAPYL